MPNVFKGFGKTVPEMPGGRNIIDLRNNELYTILDDWVSQNLTRLNINCFLDFRFWTSDGRVRRILHRIDRDPAPVESPLLRLRPPRSPRSIWPFYRRSGTREMC
jgi:hypothetical protein